MKVTLWLMYANSASAHDSRTESWVISASVLFIVQVHEYKLLTVIIKRNMSVEKRTNMKLTCDSFN